MFLMDISLCYALKKKARLGSLLSLQKTGHLCSFLERACGLYSFYEHIVGKGHTVGATDRGQ
jgi:hypothetical protein